MFVWQCLGSPSNPSSAFLSPAISAGSILVLEMLTHPGCIFLSSGTGFVPVTSRIMGTEEHQNKS